MNREQVIEKVQRVIHGFGSCACDPADKDRHPMDEQMAAEVIDAILPQVTTVEELEALPVGVVIVANNHAFLRIPAGWRVDGQQGIWRSEWLPSEGALTVVWQP